MLLGGEPGIGKSTLLLQAAAQLGARRRAGALQLGRGVGASDQVARRAARRRQRAAVSARETCLERILEEIARLKPALVIVDSIQTVFSLKIQSAPGSIGQVREAATQLLFTAKGQNVPTILVGHVTKDGSLAGPKALEHVVDTVLYFEGERHHAHRVVRAVKNRFGAVSELGVFEMTAPACKPVPNPSKLFLAERRSTHRARPCSAASRDRGRSSSKCRRSSAPAVGNARRMASGIDQQRLALLLAVLEKRAGLNLSATTFRQHCRWHDVDEPAADSAWWPPSHPASAIAVIPPTTAMFGEVGLAGEVRGIAQAALRVREAAQMGFRRCVLPQAKSMLPDSTGRWPRRCELTGVRTVGEAWMRY